MAWYAKREVFGHIWDVEHSQSCCLIWVAAVGGDLWKSLSQSAAVESIAAVSLGRLWPWRRKRGIKKRMEVESRRTTQITTFITADISIIHYY